MKTFLLTLLASLSFSMSAFGSVTECDNIDEYWEEDSLSIASDQSSVVYFDNDTNRNISCVEGEGALLCEEDGITVVVLTNGSAAVIVKSSDEIVHNIDFSCSL